MIAHEFEEEVDDIPKIITEAAINAVKSVKSEPIDDNGWDRPLPMDGAAVSSGSGDPCGNLGDIGAVGCNRPTTTSSADAQVQPTTTACRQTSCRSEADSEPVARMGVFARCAKRARRL